MYKMEVLWMDNYKHPLLFAIMWAVFLDRHYPKDVRVECASTAKRDKSGLTSGCCCQGFRKLLWLYYRPVFSEQREERMWLLNKSGKICIWNMLYPAKLSVYCGAQTHLCFSSRYHGVSKKADCNRTVEAIASENSDLLKFYITLPLSKILILKEAHKRWYQER